MSVLVTMRVQGDTEQFRQFIETQPDRMRAMADVARAAGAIHHRFGVGDGFVIVVDEWESAEAFQAFFEGNEDLPQLMRDSGAQGQPEITFTEAVKTADEY
jgi:hypothetical protein